MKRILSHRSFFVGSAAFAAILLILFFPSSAAQAGADAAEAWLNIILPTLLPFSVLSGIFVKSGAAKKFSRYTAPVSRFFGFSACFSYVFCMSLLSGYPIGAKLTASLYEQKELSDDEAALFVNAASTSGPGFLVSAVVLRILGSPRLIPSVLIPHILAAVITAKLNGSIPHSNSPVSASSARSKSIGTVFSESVIEAVNSMLVILGAMTLFSAVSAGISTAISDFSSVYLKTLLTGILEFSSGCAAAAALDLSAALPLIAFICGFGSLSVYLQTLAICSSAGLHLKNYLSCKFMQGSLAGFFASLFCQSLNMALLFFILSFLSILMFFRKKCIRKQACLQNKPV